MYMNSSQHFRNHSAFSKKISDHFIKKSDLCKLNLKLSNSKTTLQICPTQRSQSQANQTLTSSNNLVFSHNNLQFSHDLQSPRLSQFHIKTFIRFRPQKILNDQNLIINSSNRKVAIIDKKKILCQDNFFAYDHVFQSISYQSQVYNCVCKQMVQHFVRGFNSTVFAYGQTGSGKTYTMFGDINDENRRGIIPSAIKDIFSSVNNQMCHQSEEGLINNQSILSCSMLEIYKQSMIDLLSNEKTDLKIKQNQFFNVSNLTIKQVGTEEEMFEVLKIGNQSKKIRQTNMNQASSRSHVIFTIYLEVRKQHQKRLSKFNLVDLAGSQKVSKSKVEGEGLQEAKKINLSLSCLGNTINALLKRNDHIPYRQSKLTRLLYESLGGNSLTRLIVTCSSQDTQIQETLSSLKFASRAKNLKTNPLINTLRKSQKSVSRIAYQNLKTNLNKAQNKINKVKKMLWLFKSQLLEKKFDKLESQNIKNKENLSINSNIQQNGGSKKDSKINSKEHNQLEKYKLFIQNLEQLLQNANKQLLINELMIKPEKKSSTIGQNLPFLLIAEQSQIKCQELKLQSQVSCKQSSQKKIKINSVILQNHEEGKTNSARFWEIIKTQQKQIQYLKKKLHTLQYSQFNSNKQQDNLDFKNLQKQFGQLSTQACSRIQTRKNSSLELIENDRNQKMKNKIIQIKEKEKKSKRLNIKVTGKALPVRQIYLTSPTHSSAMKSLSKICDESSIRRVTSHLSKNQKQKDYSKRISRQSINSSDQLKQFISSGRFTTKNEQNKQNKQIYVLLSQINKKLSNRNQYQRFERNVLLRQLQLLMNKRQLNEQNILNQRKPQQNELQQFKLIEIGQKIETPSNDPVQQEQKALSSSHQEKLNFHMYQNKSVSKRSQPNQIKEKSLSFIQKITLSQTSQLLLSQNNYIQQLESLFKKHFLSKDKQFCNVQRQIISQKQKKVISISIR